MAAKKFNELYKELVEGDHGACPSETDDTTTTPRKNIDSLKEPPFLDLKSVCVNSPEGETNNTFSRDIPGGGEAKSSFELSLRQEIEMTAAINRGEVHTMSHVHGKTVDLNTNNNQPNVAEIPLDTCCSQVHLNPKAFELLTGDYNLVTRELVHSKNPTLSLSAPSKRSSYASVCESMDLYDVMESESEDEFASMTENTPRLMDSATIDELRDLFGDSDEMEDYQGFDEMDSVSPLDCELYFKRLRAARDTMKEIQERKPEPRCYNPLPLSMDTNLKYTVRQSVTKSMPLFTRNTSSTKVFMLMCDGMMDEEELDRDPFDLEYPSDPYKGIKCSDYIEYTPEEDKLDSLKYQSFLSKVKPLKEQFKTEKTPEGTNGDLFAGDITEEATSATPCIEKLRTVSEDCEEVVPEFPSHSAKDVLLPSPSSKGTTFFTPLLPSLPAPNFSLQKLGSIPKMPLNPDKKWRKNYHSVWMHLATEFAEEEHSKTESDDEENEDRETFAKVTTRKVPIRPTTDAFTNSSADVSTSPSVELCNTHDVDMTHSKGTDFEDTGNLSVKSLIAPAKNSAENILADSKPGQKLEEENHKQPVYTNEDEVSDGYDSAIESDKSITSVDTEDELHLSQTDDIFPEPNNTKLKVQLFESLCKAVFSPSSHMARRLQMDPSSMEEPASTKDKVELFESFVRRSLDSCVTSRIEVPIKKMSQSKLDFYDSLLA